MNLSALAFAIGVVASVNAEETTIAAPPVAAGFHSASSDEIRPANSTGAVSETYVVAGSSAGIVVHTRDGSVVSELTLHEFWHSATGTGMELRDPRIAYDPAAKRWISAAVRGYNTLMVGVSASDDPSGAWFRYEIPFKDGCDRTRMALTRGSERPRLLGRPDLRGARDVGDVVGEREVRGAAPSASREALRRGRGAAPGRHTDRAE